jgi:hypothetical protein
VTSMVRMGRRVSLEARAERPIRETRRVEICCPHRFVVDRGADEVGKKAGSGF